MQDDQRKQQIRRTQPNLADTSLYHDYCEDDKKRKTKSPEYVIRIFALGRTVYRVKWWNALGRQQCNALTLSIDGSEREYFYLRFQCSFKSIGVDLVWYVCGLSCRFVPCNMCIVWVCGQGLGMILMIDFCHFIVC